MAFTSTSLAVGLLIVTASLTAAPRDPAPTFAAIETSIAAQDYYHADSLLGSLINDLLANGVSPQTGQTFLQVLNSGRENPDLTGLVREARLTWTQAARGEQPWAEVMLRLSIAASSAVALDTRLPASQRYEQARKRYEAAPSSILLHQLTLRAYEANEYVAAFRYASEDRAETLRIFPPEAAGLILNRLDTLIGILKLNAGDVAGAVQALADSANDLKQSSIGQRLRQAPNLMLASKLLHAGQSAPVIAYLETCAQFEYPGGEEYTDEGRNPLAPSQIIAAIRAGGEPQFGGFEIY